jgi:hypothetical protein
VRVRVRDDAVDLECKAGGEAADRDDLVTRAVGHGASLDRQRPASPQPAMTASVRRSDAMQCLHLSSSHKRRETHPSRAVAVDDFCPTRVQQLSTALCFVPWDAYWRLSEQ